MLMSRAASISYSVQSTTNRLSRKRSLHAGVLFSSLIRFIPIEYERSNYLDSNERRKVADLVGLGEDRVQTWFCNRRRKSRREGGFCQPKKSCSSLMRALFIAASSNEPKTGSMIVPTASVPPQSVVLSSGHPHIIPYPIVSPLPYRLPLGNLLIATS